MENAKFKIFMQLLLDNDRESWNTCRFVLKRSIGHFLAAKTNSAEEMDLVFQDVMITLHHLLPTCHFTGFGKLKSFVIAIADRKFRELRRNQSNALKFVSLDTLQQTSYIQLINRDEQRLDEQYLLEQIANHLDERERHILFAFYCYGEKLGEIAIRLDISVENCRVIKHRALKKLTLLVAEYKND
jgi:RNA polymerase sigma factor (sigma-70 family)